MTNTATATATAYIRVSTERQATEGVSLDAQRAKVAAWCELNGYALGTVHVDAGLSGGRADNRPGLQDALDAACRAKGPLIVYSLSRLARSTRDALDIAERLDKAGADLVSLSERIDTTTAAGKMCFRMLAVLAEFERDQISDRTRAAMQHKRACGEFTGGTRDRVRFGYRLADDGVTLVPDAAEQAVAATIRRLRATGLSLRGIAAELDAAGSQQRNGKPWHPQMVANIAAAA